MELVSGADGHGLSIRGGAIRETDVRIDGISVRDPRSENSYLSINSTSVEELQVLTGGFVAKYGGFRSGLVNAVTKEGNRERYNLSLKFDMTPANQQKFFGENPGAMPLGSIGSLQIPPPTALLTPAHAEKREFRKNFSFSRDGITAGWASAITMRSAPERCDSYI